MSILICENSTDYLDYIARLRQMYWDMDCQSITVVIELMRITRDLMKELRLSM